MSGYYIRKAKHKCSVPGCGNGDTFLISASRNISGCVYLCPQCADAAAAAAGVIKAENSKKTQNGKKEKNETENGTPEKAG